MLQLEDDIPLLSNIPISRLKLVMSTIDYIEQQLGAKRVERTWEPANALLENCQWDIKSKSYIISQKERLS